jgi:hypothetical protein
MSKNLFQSLFFHHKSHMDGTGIGAQASAVRESANSLIHGRTLLYFILQYDGQARCATRQKRGFLPEAEKQQYSSQQDS